MATSPQRIVAFSDTCYRLLLRCYPAQFRRDFAPEMAQTFRACCREAASQQGNAGVMRLWGLILADFTFSLCVQHSKAIAAQWKRLFMKNDALSVIDSRREIYRMVTQFHLNASQRTDIGPTRQSNEDTMLTVIPENSRVMDAKGALFVVADGLGGHTKGEIASDLAVNGVRDFYYQATNDDIGASLLQAMREANARIYRENMAQTPQPEPNQMMGTTCVAAVLHGDSVYVANVGDSRAYIVRGEQLLQISLDHTPQAEQLRAGTITEEQARELAAKNMITRCLGDKMDVEIDLFKESVQQGDVLVLCTDGLNKGVSDDEIRAIVAQYDPQESANKLVELANAQSGEDNVTAIVVGVDL